MVIYIIWARIFENIHESIDNYRVISIENNGVAFGKIKTLECDGGIFMRLQPHVLIKTHEMASLY